jgi:hypothetical protein
MKHDYTYTTLYFPSRILTTFSHVSLALAFPPWVEGATAGQRRLQAAYGIDHIGGLDGLAFSELQNYA